MTRPTASERRDFLLARRGSVLTDSPPRPSQTGSPRPLKTSQQRQASI